MHYSLGAQLVFKPSAALTIVLSLKPHAGGRPSDISWEIALKRPSHNPGWTYSTQCTHLTGLVHMPLLQYPPCHHDNSALVAPQVLLPEAGPSFP